MSPSKHPQPLLGPRPRPAIMWFHGGGFKPANDKRQVCIRWFAKAFASRGYIGIAPDYRTRPDPQTAEEDAVRDAIADARMALRWVRASSQTHKIDAQRLVLAGGSAGPVLVLNICHDPSRPLIARRDGVFAILDMWGAPRGDTRLFAQVNPLSPPTLLVHGAADTIAPHEQSKALSEELNQAGVENVFLSLPDAPHCPLMYMEQIVETIAGFLHAQLVRNAE